MKRITSKKEYFDSLESTVKATLAVYLTLMLAFTVLLLLDETVVAEFIANKGIAFAAGSAAAVLLAAFGLLHFGISRITWLGDFHIRLDQAFFGFLDRSNETIFHTLTTSLTSGERRTASGFTPERKNEITHAIFSSLSSDRDLFSVLLRTGIFSSWIWYWVSIYGTFTFGLLTLGAFVRVWQNGGELARFIFTLNWIMTLAHFAACMMLGRYLIGKTGRSVQHIVDAHRDDVAHVLRLSIHGQPEVIEPDVEEEYGEE